MASVSVFYDDRFLKLTKSQLLEILQVKGKKYEKRLSDLLIEQLRLGCVNNHIHPEKIIHEIDILEGVSESRSHTEPESPFLRRILNEKELWKKHFFQPGFMGKNIINALQLDRKNPKFFERLVRLVAEKTKSPEQFSFVLADAVVRGVFRAKTTQGKLTGEWIIFKKYQDDNYYLTLASHDEDEDVIFQRILTGCQSQFPFLF